MDNNEFPEKLYHYCNISAFMSIIKNKCFWLSDTKYTNDKEEICAFKDAVWAALNELVCNKKINEEMANKIWITYVYNTLPGYISCFSEEDDLLSQWRSYGDDGNGVAIGVDFNSLSIERGGPFRMCTNEKKCYGRQVLYINELWKNEIKNIFKKILDGKKNIEEVSPDDLSGRLCHNKQLINSHFYRGVSELPYKLLFAVIYTHLEFRYEMSHTITSHHVHHFHQTRIPDGTLLDYMVQYRKPLFPQFFLYPKKFLPENNPHHKEFHLRPYIQNNANQ